MKAHRKKLYLAGAGAIAALSAIGWLADGGLAPAALALLLAWAAVYAGIALAIDRLSTELLRRLAVLAAAASGLCLAAILRLTGGPESPFVLALPMVPLLVAQVEQEEEAPTWAGGASALAGVGLAAGLGHLWSVADAAAAAFAVVCATAWAIFGLRSTRKLRASALEAARLADLGKLTAAIAHEIRNPLAIAQANVGWLAEQSASLPPSTREAIQDAASDAALGLQRMQSIVEDVRSIARTTTRRWACFRPGEAVREALRLCAAARRRDLRIAVEVDDDLPLLLGDRGRVVQVLTNLLSNAAEALVDTPEATVRIWACAEAGCVRLGVDDNGPGLPREVRTSLFQPFVTSKPAGLGLGLPLAAELVREHGGTLEHVPLAQGTRFTFALPIGESAAPAKAAERAAA